MIDKRVLQLVEKRRVVSTSFNCDLHIAAGVLPKALVESQIE